MKNERLTWGWILIGLGVFLLLERLGALAGLRISLWRLVLGVALVGFGVKALVDGLARRSSTSGAGSGTASAPVEELSVPLEGALRGRVELRHGAGRLLVTGGAASDQLLEGSFAGGARLTRRSEGDALVAELAQRSDATGQVIWPWNIPPQGGLRWEVRLNPSIPLALDVRGGANEMRLSLTDLAVTDLRLETGASSAYVDLPAQVEHTRVVVRTGAASVVLRVPEGVAARIRGRGGMASLKVDTSRFPRVGDAFQSPDYETARHVVEIDSEAGVASVEVR